MLSLPMPFSRATCALVVVICLLVACFPSDEKKAPSTLSAATKSVVRSSPPITQTPFPLTATPQSTKTLVPTHTPRPTYTLTRTPRPTRTPTHTPRPTRIRSPIGSTRPLPVTEFEPVQTKAPQPTGSTWSSAVSLTKTPVASATLLPSNIDRLDSSVLRSMPIILFAASPEWSNTPDSYLDLDTGATPLSPPLWNLPSQAFDLQLTMNQMGHFFLKPINGAQVRPMGKSIPGFDRCKEALTSIEAEHLTSISVGDYFCFLSNQGHLSQVTIDARSDLSEERVQIDFMTWKPTVAPSVTPLPSKTPLPPFTVIRHSARLPLVADSSEANLELDTGARLDVSELDLKLIWSDQPRFESIGDAQAVLMGPSAPSPYACYQALNSGSATRLTEVLEATYLCVQTTAGRLSQLYIEKVPDISEEPLRISFITWEQIVTTTLSINSLPTPTNLTEVSNDLNTVRLSGLVPLFAEPSVDFSEEVNLKDSYLDLDQGTTQDISGGDLHYSIWVAKIRSDTLNPVNGAQSLSMGQSAPGFEGCQQAINDFTEGTSPEFNGTYLCVLTNEGRLSQVRISSYIYLGQDAIVLSYITWEEVVVAK